MSKQELNAQSPLRLVETVGDLIATLPGPGGLAVVMSRAGVGKTNFLVQVGIDGLLAGGRVLHLSMAQTVEHIQSRYDTLIDDWCSVAKIEDRATLRAQLARQRMITAFADRKLWLGRAEETAEVMRRHLDFSPTVVLVDGYDWEGSSTVATASILGGLKSYSRRLGAALWMTAQTHREATGPHPTSVPEPCRAVGELINLGLFLEPNQESVRLRSLCGGKAFPEAGVDLDPDALRPVGAAGEGARLNLPASTFTLLSGGAQGAEEAFGGAAEQWGLREVNFTCEGRKPARERGMVLLSDEELAQGAVSEVYLRAHMKRNYPQTDLFRKTLQTIWHQVKTAGEVYVVGVILEDGTVKGGTGWAAELARHWGKPVFVFDQERKGWQRWDGQSWVEAGEPRVGSRRFCGTGTRFLSDEGRAAIQGLFARSFGSR